MTREFDSIDFSAIMKKTVTTTVVEAQSSRTTVVTTTTTELFSPPRVHVDLSTVSTTEEEVVRPLPPAHEYAVHSINTDKRVDARLVSIFGGPPPPVMPYPATHEDKVRYLEAIETAGSQFMAQHCPNLHPDVVFETTMIKSPNGGDLRIDIAYPPAFIKGSSAALPCVTYSE